MSETLKKDVERPVTRKEYTVDSLTYAVRFMGRVDVEDRRGKRSMDRWELLLLLGDHGAKQEAWQDFGTYTSIEVVAGRFGVGPRCVDCECGDTVTLEAWNSTHNCYALAGEAHHAAMMDDDH